MLRDAVLNLFKGGKSLDQPVQKVSEADEVYRLVVMDLLNDTYDEYFHIYFVSSFFGTIDLKTNIVREFPDEMQGVMAAEIVSQYSWPDLLNIIIRNSSCLLKYFVRDHIGRPDTNVSIVSSILRDRYRYPGIDDPVHLMHKIVKLISHLRWLLYLKLTYNADKDPLGIRRAAVRLQNLCELMDKSESNFSANLEKHISTMFSLDVGLLTPIPSLNWGP